MRKGVKIWLVPIWDVPEIIEEIMPLLREAIEMTSEETSVQIVKHQLLVGKTRVIIAEDENHEIFGISTLQEMTYVTGHKAMLIPLTAGTDMGQWLMEGLEMVEEYAKEKGCKELRGFSRREGWLRALKGEWEPVYQVIRKLL